MAAPITSNLPAPASQGAAAGGSNPASAQLLFSFFPDGASVPAANQTIGYRLLRWAGFFRHAGVPRWCDGCCHHGDECSLFSLLGHRAASTCLPHSKAAAPRHSCLVQSPSFRASQPLPNMRLVKSLPACRPAILKAGGLFTQELQVGREMGKEVQRAGRLCKDVATQVLGKGGEACKDAERHQTASACALGEAGTGRGGLEPGWRLQSL